MCRERKKRLPLLLVENDENILALGSAKLSRKIPELDIFKEPMLTHKERVGQALFLGRGAGLPSMPLHMRPRARGQNIT